jgi:hypothetical protein
MSLKKFKIGLSELYQGEATGEVVFYRLLRRFDLPNQLYKLGSLLQLETEAKARLRPAVFELGLDLVELDESRDKGNEFNQTFEGMDWREAMAHLATLNEPFVNRYREIAESAPPEYQELADSMVAHEQSIQRFAELEAAGKGDQSIDDVLTQLVFPLPKEG